MAVAVAVAVVALSVPCRWLVCWCCSNLDVAVCIYVVGDADDCQTETHRSI